MKRISLLLMSLIFCLSVLVPAKAADPAVNRSLGYFENSRTVLLLRARYRSGEEAAAYVNREMERIFRYPYYRTLDTSAYEADLYSASQLRSSLKKKMQTSSSCLSSRSGGRSSITAPYSATLMTS